MPIESHEVCAQSERIWWHSKQEVDGPHREGDKRLPGHAYPLGTEATAYTVPPRRPASREKSEFVEALPTDPVHRPVRSPVRRRCVVGRWVGPATGAVRERHPGRAAWARR